MINAIDAIDAIDGIDVIDVMDENGDAINVMIILDHGWISVALR